MGWLLGDALPSHQKEFQTLPLDTEDVNQGWGAERAAQNAAYNVGHVQGTSGLSVRSDRLARRPIACLYYQRSAYTHRIAPGRNWQGCPGSLDYPIRATNRSAGGEIRDHHFA